MFLPVIFGLKRVLTVSTKLLVPHLNQFSHPSSDFPPRASIYASGTCQFAYCRGLFKTSLHNGDHFICILPSALATCVSGADVFAVCGCPPPLCRAKWSNSHKFRGNSREWACSSRTFPHFLSTVTTHTHTDAWQKELCTILQPVSH